MRTAAHPRGDEARDRSAQRRSGQNRRALRNVSDSERWLPVEESGGLYEVSNFGRVRKAGTGQTLRAHLTSNGYVGIAMLVNGRQFHRRVHRLVAIAFIEPTSDDANEVNHIDFNKTNNHVSNLEWCTRIENVTHFMDAVRAGEKESPTPRGYTRRYIARPQKRKFSDSEAAGIIRLASMGIPIRRLSKEFQVAPKTIMKMIYGETYA